MDNSSKQPEEALKAILAQFGDSVINNPARLYGIFIDFYNKDTKILKIFKLAFNENLLTKLNSLKQDSTEDLDLKIRTIKQNFVENNALNKNIGYYVVDCFSYALGLTDKIADLKDYTLNESPQDTPDNNQDSPPEDVTIKDTSSNFLSKKIIIWIIIGVVLIISGYFCFKYMKSPSKAETEVSAENTDLPDFSLSVPKDDLYLLNSIFENNTSKECIDSKECRLALLDYYKQSNLYGKPDPKNVGNYNEHQSGWQVQTKSLGTTPNTIFYPRLYDKDSKYPDFAILIKNNNTGERRLVYYSFQDDGTPIFRYDETAPQTGDIIDMKPKGHKVETTYSD